MPISPPKPETTAVRETKSVDVDCRCIDIVQEVLCRLVMIGDDHFRVACAVFLDMRDIVIGETALTAKMKSENSAAKSSSVAGTASDRMLQVFASPRNSTL